jgi:hypothetical protein
MAGFDFNVAKQEAAKAERGIDVTLTDEDGVAYDPPFVIRVAGINAERVRVAQSMNAYRLAGEAKDDESEDARVMRMGKVTVTGQPLVAAHATLGWNLTAGGEDVPLTIENAVELYRVKPHIMDQVLSAARSLDASFFRADGTARRARRGRGGAGAAARGRAVGTATLGIVAPDAPGTGEADPAPGAAADAVPAGLVVGSE